MSEERYTDEILCGDVMRTPVVTAEVMEPISEIARKMKEEKVGSVVIVDKDMNLLGIITKTDIVYQVVAEGRNPDGVRAVDIMTRQPYYVYKDTPLREAAELMGYYGIGHLPVLDRETSKVVGMISKTDIISIAPDYIAVAYAYLRSRE
ncbi:MAG: CBS domain-containing protein [Desulfurococcales archaeon]|nr:CBS domain-containing protein [Desulfurococcales archaeon]